MQGALKNFFLLFQSDNYIPNEINKTFNDDYEGNNFEYLFYRAYPFMPPHYERSISFDYSCLWDIQRYYTENKKYPYESKLLEMLELPCEPNCTTKEHSVHCHCDLCLLNMKKLGNPRNRKGPLITERVDSEERIDGIENLSMARVESRFTHPFEDIEGDDFENCSSKNSSIAYLNCFDDISFQAVTEYL